jgi:c-di-GMP-binding flagellar brake protein YcgR
MERRRHKRIYISVPVRIQVKLPESSQVFWDNRGVLENFSYGGIYFRSNGPPPLEQGQIGDFTITPTQETYFLQGNIFLTGTCRVVRIDPPPAGYHDIGVAIELISAKFFDFLIYNS